MKLRNARPAASRWTAPGALALAALFVGCGGGIEVRSDYEPGTDFSQYSTFVVLGQPPGEATLDQFWEARVQNAVARDLESKGWRRVQNQDQADIAIGFQMTTEQRSSYQTVSTGWGGYGYGYGGWYGPGWGGGMSTSSTREYRYEVGQLVIAMFDTDRDEMVFVSTGSGTIDDTERTPEEAEARANDVVSEILRDFPPGGAG